MYKHIKKVNNIKNERIGIMEEKNKKDDKDIEKYGEFMSSYFEWTSLEDQKKIANRLENITKNKKKQE